MLNDIILNSISYEVIEKLQQLTNLKISEITDEFNQTLTGYYVRPTSPIYLPFAYLRSNLRIDNIKGLLFCDAYNKYYKENNLSSRHKIPYKEWKIMQSQGVMVDFFEIEHGKEDIGVRIYSKDNVNFFHTFPVTETFLNFLINNFNNKENNSDMKMPTNTMNFEFGPIKDGSVVLSPYGIAIKSNNSYMAYNANANQTVDVTGFTFDLEGMIYKMPVALNSVRDGDIILHNGKPMFVSTVANNTIEAIDITASEAKTIIPITNVFGFNFVTKIVSMMDMTGMTPSPDQPFGNLMPLMMMQSLFNKEDNNDNDPFFKMMMFSAMMNSGNGNMMFPGMSWMTGGKTTN